MTRDMDLIRALLLWIDEQPRLDGTLWLPVLKSDDVGITDEPLEKVQYHLRLLKEAGFIKAESYADGSVTVAGLTWAGHEFLDNVKDVGIWKQVKSRLDGLPSVALTVVADLAKAEIKKHLGL